MMMITYIEIKCSTINDYHVNVSIDNTDYDYSNDYGNDNLIMTIIISHGHHNHYNCLKCYL